MKGLIHKKKTGEKLTKEEYTYFINGYVNGTIPDYQAAALITCINIHDLDEEETAFMTEAMLKSGKIWDLSGVGKTVLDKHSIGGVGDKVSIALVPLVASVGGYVGKTSGRALGYCGGTIDKLEGIPGMKLYLSQEEYVNQIKNIGACLIGANKEISPADKKILPLRDSIDAYGSRGLIVSSIMSKKLAANSDCVVIDTKCGEGSFCKTVEESRKVAKQMIAIGKSLNKDIKCVITDMEQPLGYAVGNLLEVVEAMEVLKGKGPKDCIEVVLALSSVMLVQGKIAKTKEEAKEKLIENLNNGKAYEKFKEWIKAQGGDIDYLEEFIKSPKSKSKIEIKSENEGFIKKIIPSMIGTISMNLGAGKENLKSEIDYTAGIILNKKVGDYCKKGDLLCTLYTNKDEKAINEAIQEVKKAYEFSINEIEFRKPVIEFIE